MKRRILVLFADEWDRSATHDPGFRDRFEFLFEGFDLFSFPANARLFTFDALKFVERIVGRYRAARLDAVVTSDEQFGPFLASLIAERLGVPHTPLAAVLRIQHKYYARESFQALAPEANTPYGLLRHDFSRPADVPLAFPFYVKPVKAAFSVLARRVDSFAHLHRHTRFGWFERAIIDRLVQPFADVMSAHSSLVESPFGMVCEGILRGRQVTANGFVRGGKARMLGTVDSVMYPGTDQFQRFQYPSTLPPEQLERVDALAVRLLEGLGFEHGMFNVEMRLDPGSGAPRVIEINPRVAGQFYDLFERVDGFSLFGALLDLHSGLEPVIRHRQGRDRHAASFVLRDLAGEGLTRWPRAGEIARLRERNPDIQAMVYPKRGVDLRREMKWLGSYRYGVFNLGGESLEAMFARFHRICGEITFHPPSHREPDVARLVARAAGGDD